MSGLRIHAAHPSFNDALLSASPEHAAAAFVACGDLSVDDLGRVWRRRRKVGGNYPRMDELSVPVRAENTVKSGRHQIQVYVLGKRIVCLAARLVWYLQYGEIPAGYHIHHRNKDYQDNNLSNLECILGTDHISEHSIGRTPHNKGTRYGLTDAFKKAIESRQRNHEKRCNETKRLWADGLCADAISEIQGICTRQVYSRLQYKRPDGDV